LRISTTAAAIWQQMMKIPEILAILKRNNHSKRKAGEVLMSQLRDYQLHQPPYNTSYIHNFDVPVKWWKTCQMDPPYLQYLAVKLFSVSPHAASCERIWSVCGWIHGTRRTRLLVENLDAIAQIHSYYIANNKFELSYQSKEHSEEEIRQILKDADLNEDEEEISLDEIIFNDQPNDNDDLEIITEEPLKVEETLDLSKFLQNVMEGEKDNNNNNRELESEPIDLEAFNQEEDYDPAELATMFL